YLPHAPGAVLGSRGLALRAAAPAREPGVAARGGREELAEGVGCARGGGAQASKGEGEVDAIGRHELEELLGELEVALVGLAQAELRPELGFVGGAHARGEALELHLEEAQDMGIGAVTAAGEGEQRLGEARQV